MTKAEVEAQPKWTLGQCVENAPRLAEMLKRAMEALSTVSATHEAEGCGQECFCSICKLLREYRGEGPSTLSTMDTGQEHRDWSGIRK